MATHSSMLAWRISWTQKTGKLQPIGSQSVGHDWSDLAHTHPWLNHISQHCQHLASSLGPLFLWAWLLSSFSSVTQSSLTLRNPIDCSTPGLPVHHQLPEFTQTHVHWVGDAIQPSHPLSSPSPPAFNLSQHQGLFQWVSSSHQVAKVLEFQLQHQSFCLDWDSISKLLSLATIQTWLIISYVVSTNSMQSPGNQTWEMLNYNWEATVYFKCSLERAAKYFWIISLTDKDSAMSAMEWLLAIKWSRESVGYWAPRELGLHTNIFGNEWH